MVGGTRRYHHKSRNGCGQCKRRHIKCDLRAPLCANCDKKGLPCEYLELAAHGAAHDPAGTRGHDGPGSTSTLATRSRDMTGSSTCVRRHGPDRFAVLTFRVDPTSPASKRLLGGCAPSPWARLDPPGRDRLRSHWSRFTAYTITITEASDNFYTRGIAVSPPSFVVSICKCLAALHLAALRQSPAPAHVLSPPSAPGILTEDPSTASWAVGAGPGAADLIEAYKHLQTALAVFRTQITTVNQSNWLACVAFSMHVVVVNIDNARRAPLTDFRAVVMDPVKALRITLTMRNITRTQLLRSVVALKEFHEHKSVMSKNVPLCMDTVGRLDSLLRRMERHTGRQVDRLQIRPHDYVRFMHDFSSDEPPTEEGADSRLLAAVALKGWVLQNAGVPRDFSDLSSWEWCLSPDFMALLAAKDDATLVVMVHWFVIIARVPHRWYLEGWAQHAVIACMRHIGPGWDDMLAWPKAQLGLDRVDVALGELP